MINQFPVHEARGYCVGDLLKISAPTVETQVVRVSAMTVFVRWPWSALDPDVPGRWDGTVGFPRDREHRDWRSYPWRLEPDVSELAAGSRCWVGMPETLVHVGMIVRYDPPLAMGCLPRPEVALGVRLVDYLDDEESGFTLYLDSDEPIVIEQIARAKNGG